MTLELTRRGGRTAVLISLAALVAFALASLAAVPAQGAQNFPSGFSETLVAGGLDSPAAMAFTRDGRIFVAQQGGQVRVIRDGNLLDRPFVNLAGKVDSRGERGVLGVAIDPNFERNHYVYVYYTLEGTPSRPAYNQVARFTARGNRAVAGSERLVMRLDRLSGATNHNGGAIHFGGDGKLYVAVGDNADGSNAQSLATRHGKMLRIDKSGSIPKSNPFYGRAEGNDRAIWALGLRNPYSFDVHRGTGRIFINDVGQSTWEEINDGAAGANYGWPASEGPDDPTPQFTGPVHAYGHGNSTSTGCAVTGGTFYDPVRSRFPSTYSGDYFYADFCSGWIRVYDPVTDGDSLFATGAGNPVDLEAHTDGYLYYLSRANGAVYRVDYTAP